MPTAEVVADAFYEQLLVNLRAKNHPFVQRSSDPAAELRTIVRLQSSAGDNSSRLVTVSVWGNPIMADDAELKSILKVAIDTLAKISVEGTQSKVLVMPAL